MRKLVKIHMLLFFLSSLISVTTIANDVQSKQSPIGTWVGENKKDKENYKLVIKKDKKAVLTVKVEGQSMSFPLEWKKDKKGNIIMKYIKQNETMKVSIAKDSLHLMNSDGGKIVFARQKE